MAMRKSDHPEVRKLALMRRADTESGTPHNIGGVPRRTKARPKPSLAPMPWDKPVTHDDMVRRCRECGSARPGMQPLTIYRDGEAAERGYWHLRCFEIARKRLK